MSIVSGSCKALVVAGSDRSVDCTGKLVIFMFKSGNEGFNYITKDELMIGFATEGKGGVKPDKDSAVEPVYGVVADASGEVIKAVGFCRYVNPYQGEPAVIECEAYTARGTFGGRFMTDGTPPEIKRF